MRAPHPKTLAAAFAKAEATTITGSSFFSAAEARALIYESTQAQGMVHYNGPAASRAVDCDEVWHAAGYSDVCHRIGAWCNHPEGRVFSVSVMRPNGGWHLKIVTVALPTR
jgi:hypothetical protein